MSVYSNSMMHFGDYKVNSVFNTLQEFYETLFCDFIIYSEFQKNNPMDLLDRKGIELYKELTKLELSKNTNYSGKIEFDEHADLAGCHLQYIPSDYITYEMCKRAVANTAHAVEYVPQCFRA